MLKLENSIRGLSFSRVAFDLTIQDTNKRKTAPHKRSCLYVYILNYIIAYVFFVPLC